MPTIIQIHAREICTPDWLKCSWGSSRSSGLNARTSPRPATTTTATVATSPTKRTAATSTAGRSGSGGGLAFQRQRSSSDVTMMSTGTATKTASRVSRTAPGGPAEAPSAGLSPVRPTTRATPAATRTTSGAIAQYRTRGGPFGAPDA